MNNRAEKPFVVTFAAQVCISGAANADAARETAVQWGMRYVTENVTVPNADDGAEFLVDTPPCAADSLAVPLAGSFSFMVATQEEANELAAQELQRAYDSGVSEAMGARLGAWRILPGAPFTEPENRHETIL